MSRGLGCTWETSQNTLRVVLHQKCRGLRKAACPIWPNFFVPGQLRWYTLGIGQAMWSRGSWKEAQKLSFTPDNFWRNFWKKIPIFEGTKGKIPSLVSISVDWLCFREFCLEKDSKATTWLRRQECHDWLAMSAQVQDGVLWLVCLEIYTAAFRREICDSLCQRQGMFL